MDINVHILQISLYIGLSGFLLLSCSETEGDPGVFTRNFLPTAHSGVWRAGGDGQ